MIICLQGAQGDRHPDLFDQMFRLRARAFAERRKWRVSVSGGREIDRFDELDPLYLMSLSAQGDLLASLRILPTTGPHMLADVFPETMGELPPIRHPLIWESSRFCVDTKAANAHAPNGVNKVTGELLVGLFETALRAAVINIVSVYDLYLERILQRSGCTFERLAAPWEYDGLKTVAGLFEVTRPAIRHIREAAGIVDNVIVDSEEFGPRSSPTGRRLVS
jgi:N-acyl-L-homoserine lactone synthetase